MSHQIEVQGKEYEVSFDVLIGSTGIGHWECHGRGYDEGEEYAELNGIESVALVEYLGNQHRLIPVKMEDLPKEVQDEIEDKIDDWVRWEARASLD